MDDDNPLAELRHDLLYGEAMGYELPKSIDALKQLLASTENSHQKFCIWKQLRALGELPSDVDSEEVFGVVGEVGMPGGAALIFGLADGSASMYTSNGGGIMGGHSHEGVRHACDNVVNEATNLAGSMPIVEEFPYPESGILRIAIMTPRGMCAEEIPEPELSGGQHRLSPLFNQWNNLVTQLRLMNPDERKHASQSAAPHYVNCLLTLMWEKSLPPLSITFDQSLPDLRKLATTDEDHRFLDHIEVPCADVDSGAACRILMHLAKFRWYKFWKTAGQLRAKMATSPETAIDVCFDIEKSTDHQQRRCLLITRSEVLPLRSRSAPTEGDATIVIRPRRWSPTSATTCGVDALVLRGFSGGVASDRRLPSLTASRSVVIRTKPFADHGVVVDGSRRSRSAPMEGGATIAIRSQTSPAMWFAPNCRNCVAVAPWSGLQFDSQTKKLCGR